MTPSSILSREIAPSSSTSAASSAHGATSRRTAAAVDELAERRPGVPQDLEAERVERADPDRTRLDAERRQGRVDAFGELDRGTPVERDGRERVGRDARRHEPGDARDEGRGLAAPGRRDDEHRPGRGRRRGALIGRELREPLDDGRMDRHRRQSADDRSSGDFPVRQRNELQTSDALSLTSR